MFRGVSPVQSLIDKWKKMDIKTLENEYRKYAELNGTEYIREKIQEVQKKNKWLELLKSEYAKTPESKLRLSILGDWKCSGDCDNCRHKHTELSTEFGKWVDSLDNWQLFFTGTFDTKKIVKDKPTWTQIGEEFTRKAFNRFLIYLNDYNYPNNDWQITYVAGLEKQSRGDFHVHALLGNMKITNIYGIQQWKLWWDNEYGWSSWYVYEKNKGANYYLCKYLVKDGNISINVDNKNTTVYNVQPDLVSAL